MIQLTHVRLSEGGTMLHHITHFKWYQNSDGTMSTITRENLVAFLRNGNRAYVCDGHNISNCEVVDAQPTAYVRTVADKSQTDNLLQLPRF